jgi:arsenate reductase
VIRHSAAAVLFVHNHPSGDPTPSKEDIEITRRLREVGELVGTQPTDRVHPKVVGVMRGVGIDLSTAQPTRLTHELAAGAQLLVTMGCGESCPVVPGLRRQDWNLPDPKGQPIERVRAIRDDVRNRVERLITAEGWQRSDV